MPQRVTARPVGAHVIVKLTGALDADATTELRTFLLEALEQGWIYLVVDLTDAEHVGTGVDSDAMLDHIARQASAYGGCCHLIPPEQLIGRGELLPPCLNVEGREGTAAGHSPPSSQEVMTPPSEPRHTPATSGLAA